MLKYIYHKIILIQYIHICLKINHIFIKFLIDLVNNLLVYNLMMIIHLYNVDLND